MKVCFDSNAVIDIFVKDQWFFDSFAAYDVAALKRFDACISAASTSDIVYVLHRRGLSRKESLNALPSLLDLFDVFDVTAADCRNAEQSFMTDYEDALLAYAAYRNGVDLIVTRNTRDFKDSPVKAISPKEFVALFKPDNIEYGRA